MNKITMASSSHDLIQASINISIPDLCPIIFCDPANPSGFCPSPCLSLCSSICRYPLSSLIPPPPTTFSSDHQSDKITHKLIPYLIVTLAVLVTAFVLVCHYFIYVRFRRNTLRVRSLDNNINDRAVPSNQLLDQEHGPEIDHPIWYIRTLGLQSSVISAITVCKYKRGDGPVEGTDCAVCLSEFQEDETLRLLPKCNHAFHIPCIDTWLRSHTNCPICRAGIVANNVLIAPSPELTVSNLGNSGETRVEVLENNEESVNESESQAEHVHNFKKEASGILPMRRSVSMGCTSASMINLDTTTVVSLQSGHGSNNQLAKVSEYDVATSSNNIPVGNQKLVRLTGSSSLRRCCENGSSSIKRSQSCTGKFLLSQYSRNKDSTLPL